MRLLFKESYFPPFLYKKTTTHNFVVVDSSVLHLYCGKIIINRQQLSVPLRQRT